MNPHLKAVAKVIVKAEELLEKMPDIRSDILEKENLDLSKWPDSYIEKVQEASDQVKDELKGYVIEIESLVNAVDFDEMDMAVSDGLFESHGDTYENLRGSLGMLSLELGRLSSLSYEDIDSEEFNQSYSDIIKEISEIKTSAKVLNKQSKPEISQEAELSH